MSQSLVATALAAGLVLVLGCVSDPAASGDPGEGTSDLGDAPEGPGEQPGAPVRKLYAIDGTNNSRFLDWTHVSSLEVLWSGPKQYYAGVVAASQAWLQSKLLLDDIMADVCADAEAGVDEVYVAGFSRGAVLAIAVAHEVAAGRCSTPRLRVGWVGVVDPVDTGMAGLYDFSRALPVGTPSDVLRIETSREPFPLTAFFQSFPVTNAGSETLADEVIAPSHAALGKHPATLRFLHAAARRAGGTLVDVPAGLDRPLRD